jgi:hypothetical protein
VLLKINRARDAEELLRRRIFTYPTGVRPSFFGDERATLNMS